MYFEAVKKMKMAMKIISKSIMNKLVSRVITKTNALWRTVFFTESALSTPQCRWRTAGCESDFYGVTSNVDHCGNCGTINMGDLEDRLQEKGVRNVPVVVPVATDKSNASPYISGGFYP